MLLRLNILFGILSKRVRTGISVFLLASCIAIGCSSATRAEDNSARAHIGFAATHPLTQAGWRTFAERLKKEPDAPKLKIFLNGPAGDDFSAIENLARGHYEFGSAALPAFPEVFPHTALISELGIIGGDNELAAAAAITELLMADCSLCQKIFKKQRIVFLGAYSSARFVLLSYDRLNTPFAFQGLATLTPGSAWDRLIVSLGGKISEDYSDASDLFARGEISATIAMPLELSNPAVKAHTRNVLIAPLGSFRGGAGFLASASYWQNLTPKARRAILNAASDGIVSTVTAYHAISEAALEKAKSEGLTIDTASPDLVEKMQNHIQTDILGIAQTAQERFGIVDAANFIDRFSYLYDKFAGLLTQAQSSQQSAQVLREQIFDRLDVLKYGVEPG